MLKELHDGSMVDVSTPTKLIGDKRYLLTVEEQEDIDQKGSALAQLILSAKLKSNAQALLDKSDITILRCVESGTSIPQEWKDYRETLRSIVLNGTGTIPTTPAYP